MNKKAELEKLNREIRKCKKCPLWKTRNNVVPGEGPVDAKIIICGQSPGAQEDKTGRPFVGPAGKFLNHLLKLASINREKVFITSPLKCLPRPPINRKPKREETGACLPYLEKQIEIINPKYFILLGEVAFSVFFPKDYNPLTTLPPKGQAPKLQNFRGKWIKKNNKEFFITYHPAAGLRFPKIRKVLEKDFKNLAKSF